jgi:hypothetical protein
VAVRTNAEMWLLVRRFTEKTVTALGDTGSLSFIGCDFAGKPGLAVSHLTTAHRPFGSRGKPFVPQGRQECPSKLRVNLGH